jgi:ribonuclease P protein component
VSQHFRPAQRIRRRPEFKAAYDRGQRVSGRLMTVFLFNRPDAGPARLGIAATRKFGGAVQRNRAKRVVRDVFRRTVHPPGLDVVVVPRSGFLEATYQSIEADYAASIARRRAGRSAR